MKKEKLHGDDDPKSIVPPSYQKILNKTVGIVRKDGSITPPAPQAESTEADIKIIPTSGLVRIPGTSITVMTFRVEESGIKQKDESPPPPIEPT